MKKNKRKWEYSRVLHLFTFRKLVGCEKVTTFLIQNSAYKPFQVETLQVSYNKVGVQQVYRMRKGVKMYGILYYLLYYNIISKRKHLF